VPRITMKLTCWEASTQAVSFEEVMTWCVEQHAVNRLLLVLRLQSAGNKWRYAEPRVGEVLNSQFGSYIVTGFPALEWPGTQASQPAFVYVLNFNDEVKEVVLRTQPSLSNWLHQGQSSLPEDPCLFKDGDSNPVFVSSTHHDLAWLLSDRTPSLNGFKSTNYQPETFFAQGKYFCRKFQKRKCG